MGSMRSVHGLTADTYRTNNYRTGGKASVFSTKNRKNPFADNPYIQKGLSDPARDNPAPDYQVGDTVSHIKFGNGTVNSITKLNNDYEVVIEFENFGTRKLRSSFAKLKKI